MRNPSPEARSTASGSASSSSTSRRRPPRLAGYSKREACRLTGVPRTTLSVSLDKAGLTESDRAKYLDIVEDLALRAAEESGRQRLERLEGDTTQLTPMQLATVFGIWSDKLTAVRI